MNDSANHKPQKLNLDSHPKYVQPDEGYYILNQEISVNTNGGTNNGASAGLGTPTPANFPACEIDKPAGENYAPNTYHSKLTGETYSWVLNSNGANYIQRINAKGLCEIVYQGGCVPLSPDPKFQITQFKAYMRYERLCANRDGKALIWTTGDAPIGWIDTEASIATNNFTTDFFDRCRDDCAYVQMCVPEICGCIQAEFIPLPPEEAGLTNHIVDLPIQIAIRHVYYDLRANEWAISSTYFQDSKGCFDSAAGFSRCMKLRFPIGNPLVDKIEVAFSTDGGVSWKLYDTIEKYKKYNNSQVKWYQRELSEQVSSSYSDEDCSFDYYFCNDKQCQSIDKKEFTRVRNPMPRLPQSIIEVKDSLGFVNYIDGLCPLDKAESEKLDIGIDCSNTACVPELATITIRAVIHNTNRNTNQFIYRYNGSGGEPDDPLDTAHFGGTETTIPGTVLIKNGYGQNFSEKTRNFIAYVEGTGYYGEMKQRLNTRNLPGSQEVGVVNGMDDQPTAFNRVIASISLGYYQEVKIKVPKGTKGFIRLCSHKATGLDDDSSTFVVGTLDIRNYSNASLAAMGYTALKEEIYVDTCEGDVELFETFIINDNATNAVSGNHSSVAYSGYIKDNFGVGIEGAEIWGTSGTIPVTTLRDRTDHNGFYSFTSWGFDFSSVTIRLERSCAAFANIDNPLFITHNGDYTMHERDYKIENLAYNTNHYTNVNVSVLDCDGLGVGGLRVALSGSKYRATDATGIARFKVRNYSNRQREVRAVLINLNGCLTTDCNDNCSPCMPDDSAVTPNCYTATTVSISGFVVNRESLVTKKGLKHGGRYPFGYFVQGDCGMVSAVYHLEHINIPKVQDQNKLGFCDFTYDGTGMKLPSWGKCLKLVRGINLNPFELQWVVDKIEKQDGKIKITIQSLSNYNEKFLFKTNTVYNWLKGDRIEFIRNGDGSIFTTAAFGSLNYLTVSPFNDELESGDSEQPADFFNQLLIEDDGRLDDLKIGAIFEIQRAKECVTEPVYHEICVSIPLVPDDFGQTELLYPTGTFSTFDTFLVNRIIGSLPLMPFEHHSPSDFWGQKVSDIGKAHFLNPYENEKRFGRNISINSPTQFNYFGDLIKRFDAPGQGDITAAMVSDGRIGMFICEHDVFIAEIADDLVRVGSDGVIRALPPDAIISDGQPKIGGQYGCQYPHIGSILFCDGFTTFWDVNAHNYIVHNYSFAKPAAMGVSQDGTIITKCSSYFRKRSQEIEFFNRNEPDYYNHYRFATGQNKGNGYVYCTVKSLRHSGINNEIAPYLKPNETIIYDPAADCFRGMASFTPESYSSLNLFDGDGCSFLTYLNGIPYIHPMIALKWNEFYGIAVDWMVGISINKSQEKVKVAMAIEEQTKVMWYVKDVRTDKDTFRSEIPPIKFKQDNGKWNGNFMGNANSIEGLHKSTELPKGYYIKALFIRDNTLNLAYNSIDNNKRTQFSEIDSIITKYVFSEQSGFVEDL